MDDLLARMLAKLPEERPWDGEEVASLLHDLRKSEISEKDPPQAQETVRAQSAHPAPLNPAVTAPEKATQAAGPSAIQPNPPGDEPILASAIPPGVFAFNLPLIGMAGLLILASLIFWFVAVLPARQAATAAPTENPGLPA